MLLGAALGTAELVSRYSPLAALRTWPAVLYIPINIAASAGAFALSKILNWTFNFGDGGNQAAKQWSLVLICGVDAMAIFLSSLFVRRIGDLHHASGAEGDSSWAGVGERGGSPSSGAGSDIARGTNKLRT